MKSNLQLENIDENIASDKNISEERLINNPVIVGIIVSFLTLIQLHGQYFIFMAGKIVLASLTLADVEKSSFWTLFEPCFKNACESHTQFRLS